MKRSFYIFSNCELKRKANSLQIISEDKKKYLPIETVDNLYIFSEMTFNTKLLNFLAQKNVVVHLFNYYGFYSGSFYPREFLISGNVLMHQVSHYLNKKKRLELAKETILSASHNIRKNLIYYKNRKCPIEEQLEQIDELRKQLEFVTDVQMLMGIEGKIREYYYQAFAKIIPEAFDFEKRVKRPPDNMVNALISFGNSLLYTTCLSEIYKTQLNPTISYLHSCGDRRFSLCLDLSEIFKPIIVDRLIFTLLNKKQLSKKDFESSLNFCYLNDKGKKTLLRGYDEKLNQTIKHPRLNIQSSYRRLIRLECYKIIKHLLGEQKYEGFKAWW
ncbi:MAG: type I-B CRISPR-associated endonuclease Cas1 [Candidatus Cloacimonetes bacterium]|nr:type I-B CRISPR-associated endonuclease Cas1 [Candidatus Cloacimonadota bacterium]